MSLFPFSEIKSLSKRFESIPFPHSPREDTVRRQLSETQKRAFTRTSQCSPSHLVLEHPDSRTMSNKFMLFISHVGHDILLQQPRKTKNFNLKYISYQDAELLTVFNTHSELFLGIFWSLLSSLPYSYPE